MEHFWDTLGNLGSIFGHLGTPRSTFSHLWDTFRILVTSPPNVSSNTFVTVLHVLVIMASHGSDVGPMLLEENIGATLRQLLVGTGTGALIFGTIWNTFLGHWILSGPSSAASPSAKASTSAGAAASDDLNHSRNSTADGGSDVELVQRNPQELYEITSLVCTISITV